MKNVFIIGVGCLMLIITKPVSAQNWVISGAYGTPVYKSGYYESASSAGLAIRAPISIQTGPFVIGVGLYGGQTSGKNTNNKDFSGVEGWGALIISLKDPFVIPFSIHAGGGIVPTGLGVTGGLDMVLVSSPFTMSLSVNSTLPIVNPDLFFPHPAHLTRVFLTVSSPIRG